MFKQYRPIMKGEYFLVGVDGSMGCHDYSVAQFISKNFRDVPLVYTFKGMLTELTTQCHPVIEKLYDVTGIKPLIAYERNNGGVFEMERLAKMNRMGKYDIFRMPERNPDTEEVTFSDKLGWDTTSTTRPAMLINLKDAMDNHLLGVYDRQTISEMFSFIMVQRTTMWKAQAELNAFDDHVMALAIANQLYEYTPDVITKQKESSYVRYNNDEDRQFIYRGRRKGY